MNRIFLALAALSLFLPPLGELHAALPLTEEAKLSLMPAQCAAQVEEMLMEEINLYRGAQFGPSPRSVLQTISANTSDLVPYLVLNYHALDCRLHLICDAVGESQRDVSQNSMVLAYRPIGCSRLFAARGRWWSNDRRNETARVEPISECAYDENDAPGHTLLPSSFFTESACDTWVTEILREERQMLRLVTVQDTAERGIRRIVPVFQNVIADIRESFLIPLRGMIDLFGSVIQPIPCLLRQCN